jgi:hypothetical protein
VLSTLDLTWSASRFREGDARSVGGQQFFRTSAVGAGEERPEHAGAIVAAASASNQGAFLVVGSIRVKWSLMLKGRHDNPLCDSL